MFCREDIIFIKKEKTNNGITVYKKAPFIALFV